MDKDVFNSRVLPLFAASIFFMFVGSLVGVPLLPVLLSIYTLGIIGALLILGFFIGFLWLLKSQARNYPLNIILLGLFTVFTGILITPLLMVAVVVDPWLIPEAFGITVVTFGLLAGFVYFTNRDFRSIGVILFVLLIGAILASLVGILLHPGDLFFIIIDVVVLLIFMGFVLYDMSKILRDYHNEDYMSATVALYIDFWNMFVRILSLLLMSRRRR
jgi:FtsH-binding integral membrane protein